MSDFYLNNHGSVVLLTPNTPEAVEWVDENIGEDNGYQPYYPTVVVEANYVSNIAGGIANDGLTIE